MTLGYHSVMRRTRFLGTLILGLFVFAGSAMAQEAAVMQKERPAVRHTPSMRHVGASSLRAPTVGKRAAEASVAKTAPAPARARVHARR